MPIRSRTTLAFIITTSLIGAAALATGAVWAFGGFDEATSATTAPLAAPTTSPTTTDPATTESSSTTATTAPVTTIATTVAATTTVAAPPVTPRTTTATTQPPPRGTYSDCSSYSISGINSVRAAAGVGPLSAGSNAAACSWARHLAEAGALSHSGLPCGGTGGQVVGYVSSSAPGGADAAPGRIISNWFNSAPHYKVLTHPSFTTIGLGFVTRTKADGSWVVYGVGNVCP